MYYCPDCKHKLKELAIGYECSNCDIVYPLEDGFCVFDDYERVSFFDYGLGELELDIENEELVIKLHRYFVPHLGEIKGKSILSVGCGSGGDIEQLNCLGVEAYGMDFLCRTKNWNKKSYSKQRFFVSSVDRIPFPVEYFDIIICTGVIEHVSEELVAKGAYAELNRNRELFLKEIFDMLKPGGIIIITSPNRNFPLDFQHNAYGWLNFLSKFSIYVHSPFAPFLESYYSLTSYFRRIGEAKVEPMPLVNFLGLNIFKLSPHLSFLKRSFDAYIQILDNMPNIVRTSFLNPYIVLRVTKLH